MGFNWSYEDKDYLEIGELDGHPTALPGKIPESRTVVINTGGGSNAAFMPWYDWIRYHKLNTFAMGECSSFGFILFTAGENRGCFPGTMFMMHGPATDADHIPKPSIFGPSQPVEMPAHVRKNLDKLTAKHKETTMKLWIDRMVAISNKDRKFWENIASDHKNNHYFTAQELLEMGVVTKIYE